MGTTQDYRVAAEEGATLDPRRLRPPMGHNLLLTMGFADVWNRTLVYFGIAEEDDWDEDGYATNEELERSYRASAPNVRRLQPRRGREFDDWTDSEPEAANTAVVAAGEPPARRRGRAESAPRSRCTSSCRAASTTRSRSPTGSRTACR